MKNKQKLLSLEKEANLLGYTIVPKRDEIKLRDYQKRTLKCVKYNQCVFIDSDRQMGKTLTSAELIRGFFTNIETTTDMNILFAHMSQCVKNIIMKRIRYIIKYEYGLIEKQTNSVIVAKNKFGNTIKIDFVHNGERYCNERLRGNKLDLIIIDDINEFDHNFLDEFLKETVIPNLYHNCRFVVFSGNGSSCPYNIEMCRIKWFDWERNDI